MTKMKSQIHEENEKYSQNRVWEKLVVFDSYSTDFDKSVVFGSNTTDLDNSVVFGSNTTDFVQIPQILSG